MLEPRPLCQHNGTFDPFGRCNGCGRMVWSDLEMELDAASCTALKDWAAGAVSGTYDLDSPRLAADLDVACAKTEDNLFLRCATMTHEQRHHAEHYLRELSGLRGYPWKQHDDLPALWAKVEAEMEGGR